MLYDIAFIIFCVFYIPFIVLKKGRRHFNVKRRLGFLPREACEGLSAKRNIWLHAVSVGEVAALAEFARLVKDRLNGYSLAITVTTKAGYEIAQRLFSRQAVVLYSPFDLSFVVKRFFGLIRPEILIIVETEIWPNLISRAKACNTPVAVINGRISQRSFGRYEIARPFLEPILNKIDLFCMQSEDDARRIKFLGAPDGKVRVTGNMKFDTTDYTDNRTEDRDYRHALGLGNEDKFLVAGSTHKGEEEVLLDVYKALSGTYRNLRLLIAPRHIERAGQIETLARKMGFVSVRISNFFTMHHAPCAMHRIFLLDTVGCLRDFYAIADIVFIGGSLVKHGGQNPIEPACFSKPIIFGPFMFNFKDISQLLIRKGGAMQVKDGSELEGAILSLIKDPARAQKIGASAKSAIEENRGASDKNMEFIKALL